MGFAITWFAVREAGAQRLLDQLNLSPTGETEEFPESLISTAKLDTGWRVIWYDDYDCPFLRPVLDQVSKAQEVLVCLVEEHVMASSAELWTEGKCKWFISHEGEDGPIGLTTEGDLPDCFEAVKSDMEGAQLAAGGDDADVDYIFEIPLRVAQTIVGFKHDDNHPQLQFEVLKRSEPKPGFFKRLFK